MLQEPMMEKLTAMRLLGMVDALKTQEQDPASRDLSFLERLGLLVDQQWTWRENQALARRLHAAKLKGACVEEIDYRTSRGLDKSVIRNLTQKSVQLGSLNTNISSSSGPPAWGKASLHARWRRRHAATVIPRCTPVLSRCFVILRWRGQTAACAACWRVSAASTSWLSTTGPWPRCQNPSVTTSGRSARIATKCAPRS